MADDPVNLSVPLSVGAAEAVIERAAQTAGAGMPLATGLRTAADETDSWRLARALRSIAAQLDQGRTLDQIIETKANRLPPHLAGLIRAAQRTGALAQVLAEWLENRRAVREHWRALLTALAYPAIAVILAAAVFLLLANTVVGTFKPMLEDFGMRLPAATTSFIRLCEVGTQVIPVSLGVALLCAIGLRLIGGRSGWSWLVTNLPLVGLPWHWTGVTEMLRSLGLLLERRVPLAEALRLTADGIADGYVASQCRKLATRVEKGSSLTMSLVHLRTLPLSIVPLVRWGELHDLLPEGLKSAAEMIEGRLERRTAMLVQIIPPVVFVLVGVIAVSGVVSIFLPLISLIQGLS
jgi:type II secretory pathway component PulF